MKPVCINDMVKVFLKSVKIPCGGNHMDLKFSDLEAHRVSKITLWKLFRDTRIQSKGQLTCNIHEIQQNMKQTAHSEIFYNK